MVNAASQVAEERLKVLVCVVEKHQERIVGHIPLNLSRRQLIFKQNFKAASHGFEFTFRVQAENVPHINDNALDELESCDIDDSSSLKSDCDPLDFNPPPSPTLHSLPPSTSTYIESSITDIPPQKKKTRTQATSSIRAALEATNDATYGNLQGLLRFWKKGDQETVKKYWNKVKEEQRDADDEEAFAIKVKQNRRTKEKREAHTFLLVTDPACRKEGGMEDEFFSNGQCFTSHGP